MAGYVRGSKAHLNKLIEVANESCDRLVKRSVENEADVKQIKHCIASLYLDYASRYAAVRETDVKKIDIPEFMKRS